MCDTKYKETLINIAEKYNTDISCIQFLGYQSDVSPFFRDATAFLMCSTSEGLGRVTIEAMYYGCPVIAFASGGTTEIVKQNETGHLFLNKEELIKQMNEVTTNNQLTILHKAQDYAITNFGSKAIIPLVQSIYMKLIK
jgi:glycosyltransferase involved in cell wall biosynthesis